MLERYFGRAISPATHHSYLAMKAAAALREAMWSMVSEVHSTLSFDYAAYTDANLATYAAAYHSFKTL